MGNLDHTVTEKFGGKPPLTGKQYLLDAYLDIVGHASWECSAAFLHTISQTKQFATCIRVFWATESISAVQIDFLSTKTLFSMLQTNVLGESESVQTLRSAKTRTKTFLILTKNAFRQSKGVSLQFTDL